MSELPVTESVPLTMMRPRNDTSPWMSKLPLITMTPQPSMLPLFLTCTFIGLSRVPNCTALHDGPPAAYGSPKVQGQLLFTCVHVHCSGAGLMSRIIWLICATV